MVSGQALSPEVQKIIIQLSAIHPRDQIAAYTGVSITSVHNILNYFDKYQTIKPSEDTEEKKRKKRAGDLRDVDIQYIIDRVTRYPDIYLDELQELLARECGATASLSAIWQKLKVASLTKKKLSRAAAERCEELWLRYSAKIGGYDPEQLIFVDESSVDRRTTYRTRGWAARGAHAKCHAFFVRGKRFSVLPALSLTGIIHCDIIEGSFRTGTFYRFIKGLLDSMQPFPAPNLVIVMDNCCIHKHPKIQKLIHQRGMRCVFLPPYSPDLNPIKLAFSFMKYNLRRNGQYARMTMIHMGDIEIQKAILGALLTATPQHAFGWYKHCGYV